MLRMLVRMCGVVGLTALVLLAAVSVLAQPAARSGVAQPIGQEQAMQAATTAPNFTVVMSAVVPNGLTRPVGIANAGDGSGRLFVVEQDGYIRIIKNGALLSTPYLTLTSQVVCCGERGLLGLVFDPDFETNGTFYVNYTTSAGSSGDTVVARYQVANPAADVATVLNVTHVITIDQPGSQFNHKGGDLHFGSNDGYLYIGMGDGGGSNDNHGPIGNGQNPAVLLGKILRINVHGVPTYTVPASNPFTRTAGYQPEIWALGVRNPWRFSFDRGTGDLYIGDVGQNCWEEISYQPASSHGGENYGWRHEEGLRLFDPGDDFNCDQPASTLVTTTKPITAYSSDDGTGNSAVTGGYVYRGQQYPWMQGIYFYSDSGSGRIWAVQQISPGVWSGSQKLSSGLAVTAFGEDENGELYVTSYSAGGIYKITSPSPINFSTSSKSVSTDQASTGSMVTYTIVVRNTGVPFSDTVRVTDTVPAGLSYVAGSLAATSSVIDASGAPTLKWNGTMSTAATSIVTITYRAFVTAGPSEIITNTATIDPVLNPPLTRSATLTVTTSGPNLSGSTKQASAASAQWNEVVTYTIVLRNSGQAFTQTVRVTDTLPAGLSYVPGTLAATHGAVDDSAAPTLKWNGTLTNTSAITISYRAALAAFTSQTLSNMAAIDPGVGALFNRSAAVTVNGPDLTSSTKQASSTMARFGEVVTYTVVVRNTGGRFPTTVRVTDTLPSDLTYVAGSLAATSGTPDASSAPTLKWNGVMSVTPVVTVTFAATVTTPNITTIVNMAMVNPGYGSPFARTAPVIVNPYELFLPLILRDG